MKTSLAALALLLTLTSHAEAHELQDNRATLVLRDDQHLALTLFVDYPRVLHQILAPKSTLQEFILVHSAMQPRDLSAQLLVAQRQLQNDTRLMMSNGKAADLARWIWPTSSNVQKLLQQLAMKAVVAPNDHAHAMPMEIRAEAKATRRSDFGAVTLRLPAALNQVLVVSYQPRQVWLKPNAASPPIRF